MYTITVGILIIGLWVLRLRPLLERRKPLSNIPMIPNSHWLFGHLFWLLRKGYLEKQQELVDHADDRGRCSVWMGLLPSISLTTPTDAKRLLWNNYSRHSLPILKYHFERLAGTKNLLMINGKEWKYYQTALKTALSRVDPFLLQSITQRTTETLTRNLKGKIKKTNHGSSLKIDSIQSLMKMIVMDISGQYAFSHEF
jgi:hypothetical protein